MESLKNKMPGSITFLSDKCPVHEVELMNVRGKVSCYKCYLEWDDAHLMNEERDKYYRAKYMQKYNMLKRDSLLPDETLKKATFETYIPECNEERINKQTAIECAERFKQGEIFNVVLQGTQGTGKSHLAHSILTELNETTNYKTSSLFISVEDMLRKMKGSFNNKNSKYTEEYLVDLLAEPDFLVIDDIGSETGAIGTEKSASDFVQRILYAITTYRQGRVTIMTTNLSSDQLFQMYDPKLVSRLLKKPKFIIFKEATDKRIADIPF